jgi:predicted aconitase
MLGGFIARAAAVAGRAVIGAATNAIAAELRKPETQAKLEAHAAKLRDNGARALGRALGNLRNRD